MILKQELRRIVDSFKIEKCLKLLHSLLTLESFKVNKIQKTGHNLMKLYFKRISSINQITLNLRGEIEVKKPKTIELTYIIKYMFI